MSHSSGNGTQAGRQLLTCGLDAVLVELPGRTEVLGLQEALRRTRPDGVLEVVPAARTLLVRYDPARLPAPRLRSLLADLPFAPPAEQALDEVVVPVRYDGDDLDEVAALTGTTPREVIERHLASRFTVAFCGFAPGFAYLGGLDPVLCVPRRREPRTVVPAGSVALADEYCGIYPRPSPGGWQLIGSTGLALWDVERQPPTPLRPGVRVRFEAVPA